MTIQVSTVPEMGNLNVQGKVDRAAFLTNLLKLRSEAAIPWINFIRDRATSQIQTLSIPSTRDEEWRFTDLSPLLQVHFEAANSQQPALEIDEIKPFILPEAVNSRLVFVDGVYSPALSTVENLPVGVIVSTFSAVRESEEISETLDALPSYVAWRELAEEVSAALVQASEMVGADLLSRVPPISSAQQKAPNEVFTKLNATSMTDGAVIWVPRNQVVETPIQLLFISTATQPTIAHPRVAIVAESSSKLTVIEDFVSLNEGVYFTNAVTDIAIESNAEVNHTRVQRESTAAFHIGTTTVFQDRDSRYTCNPISLGARLSRHNLEIYQTGEQTETTLNGLTMIAGEQVADTHSTIAYTKPHGTSHQTHKCIVDHHAHAVFNGKVFVPKAAQLTDARQLSKNLLLSPKARVDTKPQLEITADNVKCAHGATVSQLDTDEVFYLQSRGIDEDSARKLLVYAFAYEVISQIPIASLQNQLAAIVRAQQT